MVAVEAPPGIEFDTPDASSLASDADFWRLYADSFPSTEREPPDVILATLQGGAGFALRGRAAGRTIALASVHLLRRPPVPFLVYLAVAPSWREHRIGGATFERTCTAAASRYEEEDVASPGLVWEVEIAERAPDQRERELRRRRISFFERRGGHILPRPYLQPPVDGIAAVPMHLMFRTAPGASLPGPSLTGEIVRAIYYEKYLALNRIPIETLERLLRQSEEPIAPRPGSPEGGR